MLFASLTFLSFFLPFCVGGYFLLPWRKLKNLFLLIVSLFFYAWGEPLYVFLMLGVIFLTYAGGLAIADAKNKKIRTVVFFLTVAGNLSVLFHYKYTDFALETLHQLGWINDTFGLRGLPVGISFYTFQAVSYLADVWRQEVKAEKNILKTALYISFFPQLIAGPILKYHEICAQISNRKETLSDFCMGLRRFSAGLAKKVLVADTLGETVDLIFATELSVQTSGIVWGAVLFYGLQLYFDFSGYSDMALGLARLFGFKFPENFNYPYVSRSMTELWRRWHISLSSWFREYVYIPLGGNRNGLLRTMLNLTIVFFLTGLWHGAAWTFVLWGLYQGFFVICEKIIKAVFPRLSFSKILGHVYLLFVFTVGLVFFRAETVFQAKNCLKTMFGMTQDVALLGWTYYFTPFRLMVFVVACVLATGLFKNFHKPSTRQGEVAANLWSVCLLVLSYAFLCAGSFNPFIYFRF